MSRILFAAQHLSPTQLNDIAHEQTIVCRKLFAGQVVGFWPIKRKKKLRGMIRCILGDVQVACKRDVLGHVHTNPDIFETAYIFLRELTVHLH